MRYDVDSIDNRSRRAIERALAVLEPALAALFHPVVRGLERIPEGPGLYVANHSGGKIELAIGGRTARSWART